MFHPQAAKTKRTIPAMKLTVERHLASQHGVVTQDTSLGEDTDLRDYLIEMGETGFID